MKKYFVVRNSKENHLDIYFTTSEKMHYYFHYNNKNKLISEYRAAKNLEEAILMTKLHNHGEAPNEIKYI